MGELFADSTELFFLNDLLSTTLMDHQTGVLGMFSSTYWVSVLTVTLGASTQFYSYGIVNPEQQLLTQWINSTYRERNGVGLNETELKFLLVTGSFQHCHRRNSWSSTYKVIETYSILTSRDVLSTPYNALPT